MDKRSIKILRRIVKSPPKLNPAASQTAVTLAFEGERTIQIKKASLQHWLSDGLVKLDAEYLVITQAGEAALRRHGAVDVSCDPHAYQHGTHEKRTGPDEEAVYVNLDESPLSRLSKLKTTEGKAWLARRELAAGERLRVDFEMAGMHQRVTSPYDPSHVPASRSCTLDTTDRMNATTQDARQRLIKAFDAIGPELSDVVLDICCFLKGLETVEFERGWPRRSAKLILKTALAALSRHYHPVARGPSTSPGIVQWGSEGFKPPW